jgi:Tfp pilus assembly protein PilZ
MDDQRRLRRIEADYSMELALEDDAAVWSSAVLVDCATGGLGVRTDGALKAGDRVRIRVTDDRMGKAPVALGVADVVRVRPDNRAGSVFGHSVGLKFRAPDAEAVDQLYHAAQVQQTVRKRAAERGNVRGKKMWL